MIVYKLSYSLFLNIFQNTLSISKKGDFSNVCSVFNCSRYSDNDYVRQKKHKLFLLDNSVHYHPFDFLSSCNFTLNMSF